MNLLPSYALNGTTAGWLLKMTANWDRWRQRHPQAGKWLPQCAAACFALLAGGAIVWLFPYQAAKADLGRMQQQEAMLKQAYIRQLQQAPQTDLMEAEKRRAEQKLALLEQQLSSGGEQEAVMNEIDAAGLARGLRFTLFKPEIKSEINPATEQPGSRHDRMAIQIRAIGTYQAIVRFSSDIARLPRIVILDPVSLQAATGKDDASAGLLVLQATAIAIQPEQRNDKKDNRDGEQD